MCHLPFHFTACRIAIIKVDEWRCIIIHYDELDEDDEIAFFYAPITFQTFLKTKNFTA